jgi:hypothetical protein
MLKPKDLPAPDTLIEYPDGAFGPLMFHFSTEGDSAKAIAADQGFDYSWVEMGDVLSDDDTLSIEYFAEGKPDVVGRWTPPEREGWTLVGKNDSENGPVAHYIRKQPTQ